VAQVSLACLHKSGSFSNLGAHIMAGMSNCFACYEGSRDKESDEVHCAFVNGELMGPTKLNDGSMDGGDKYVIAKATTNIYASIDMPLTNKSLPTRN
jgi:hypothetical protein